MNTKFCGKCGASTPAEMAFCSQCGAHFENHESVNNFNQPPATFQPSSYTPQTPFQPPQPASSFSANQSNFQPPNFSGANNLNAPNQAFQSPQFQPESQSPAYYKADPKPGIGSKIWSALGVLAVGAFLFLKFGFVLLRASRLGGIGMIAVVSLIVVAWGVYGLIRKS